MNESIGVVWRIYDSYKKLSSNHISIIARIGDVLIAFNDTTLLVSTLSSINKVLDMFTISIEDEFIGVPGDLLLINNDDKLVLSNVPLHEYYKIYRFLLPSGVVDGE